MFFVFSFFVRAQKPAALGNPMPKFYTGRAWYKFFSESNAQQSCVPATALCFFVALLFCFFDVETLVFWTLKWNEKSMKNGPKINQKSIKNGPKIDQKSSKIEVWRAPGQVWRPLGPSWAIQSVFGGILDLLGGVLEASWRGLGGLLASLGSALGASWGRLGPSWNVVGESWRRLGAS